MPSAGRERDWFGSAYTFPADIEKAPLILMVILFLLTSIKIDFSICCYMENMYTKVSFLPTDES